MGIRICIRQVQRFIRPSVRLAHNVKPDIKVNSYSIVSRHHSNNTIFTWFGTLFYNTEAV